MENISLTTIIDHLQKRKQFLYESFGVTRIGIFGSLVKGDFTASSDIDIVVEMEEKKRNIHSFLGLKRFLEKETSRRVDLGFEGALKPAIRESVRKHIVYV